MRACKRLCKQLVCAIFVIRLVRCIWICLQEKAHVVAGEIQQRRELSARAAFFVGGGEYKLDLTWLAVIY